ncbi:MAG: chalcone isomerase family protein [Bdellovibrionota bacterium]
MKIAALLTSLLVASFAQASIITNELGAKKIENVTLSTAGTYQTTKMEMVGAGLRKKKVLAMKANVYVAQVFLSSPESFVRTADAAAKTAALSQVAAVQLTFLRAVEAEKVQTSFLDALVANNIDTNAADVKAFLAAVANGGEAESKKTMTILIQKNQGSETLVYEDTAGKVTKVAGNEGLGLKVLSIWLGTPADAELGDCKNQILAQ